MKAVIFGAGNIGRGFIAPLFSFDGWDVTFVDVAAPVIERVNADHEYPLHIVGGKEEKILAVKNVSAVDGNDREAAVKAITEADMAATCVGAKAIKYILPNFVPAVKNRFAAGKTTNLLICENMMDADLYVRDLLKDMLTPEELDSAGLIETSVGRMVPKIANNTGNPLKIAVEEYGVLPVDKAAFKGEIIPVKNIVPFTPFHYYIERKLYLHNMGHAICAYLGGTMYGDEYICDAIARPVIRLICQNAMTESAIALSKKYKVDFEPIMEHAWDLLRRFGNKALGDTCERVGADIPRKLANSDRLIGCASNILAEGSKPIFVCLGAAAALYTYMKDNSERTAGETLCELSAIEKDSEIYNCVMSFYPLFEKELPLEEILAFADDMKKAETGMIV